MCVLLPDIAQQPLLQAQAVFALFGNARRGARGRRIDELQYVRALRAPARVAVPAAHAVGKLHALAAVERGPGVVLGDLWLCEGREPAPTAAVGAVQRVARLRYLAAEALRQLAYGLLRVRVASRAAGVVQRDLAAGYRRALGQAELQQQVPDARTLAQARLAQGFLAGGAGGDDPGVSELFELRAQLGAGLLEELLTPGPVGDDAAAAEQDGHIWFCTATMPTPPGSRARRSS